MLPALGALLKIGAKKLGKHMLKQMVQPGKEGKGLIPQWIGDTKAVKGMFQGAGGATGGATGGAAGGTPSATGTEGQTADPAAPAQAGFAVNIPAVSNPVGTYMSTNSWRNPEMDPRFGGLPARRYGGPVEEDQEYIVNEDGEEMFVNDDGNASIIPGGPQIRRFAEGGTVIPQTGIPRASDFMFGGRYANPIDSRPLSQQTGSTAQPPRKGGPSLGYWTRGKDEGKPREDKGGPSLGYIPQTPREGKGVSLGYWSEGQVRAGSGVPFPQRGVAPMTDGGRQRINNAFGIGQPYRFGQNAPAANALPADTPTRPASQPASQAGAAAQPAQRRGTGRRGSGGAAGGAEPSGTLTQKQADELTAYRQGLEDYGSGRRADKPAAPKWYDKWVTGTEGGKLYGETTTLGRDYSPEGAAARAEARRPDARSRADVASAEEQREFARRGFMLRPNEIEAMRQYEKDLAEWKASGSKGLGPKKPKFYDAWSAKDRNPEKIAAPDVPLGKPVTRTYDEAAAARAEARQAEEALPPERRESNRLAKIIQDQLNLRDQLTQGRGPNGEDLNTSSYDITAPTVVRTENGNLVELPGTKTKKGKGKRFVQGLKNFMSMLGEGKGVVGAAFGAATDPLYDERQQADARVKNLTDQYGAQFGHRKGEGELAEQAERIAAIPENLNIRRDQARASSLRTLLTMDEIDPRLPAHATALRAAGIDPTGMSRIMYKPDQREFGGVMFERDAETGIWNPKGVVDPSKQSVAVAVVNPKTGKEEVYFMPSQQAGKALLDLQRAGYQADRVDTRQAVRLQHGAEISRLNRESRENAAALNRAGIDARQKAKLEARQKEIEARQAQLKALLEE